MLSERKGSDGRDKGHTRRDFLKAGAGVSGLLLAQPVVGGPRVHAAGKARLLLENGLVVDGTGKKAFRGSVLIEGDQIAEVAEGPLEAACPTIDCGGKAIAPGFIDAHSHMDWVLSQPDHTTQTAPFTAQGCTAFVAGNCGFGAAGFRRSSAHRKDLSAALAPNLELPWETMEEYYAYLGKAGMSHHMSCFAGHGTSRASMLGTDPRPLKPEELKELLALLEEAMDQGAPGVSFGLQYSPGLFAPLEEIEAVARLVQKKDKIITVHGRAYSSLSSEYKINPFGGTPHNLLALQEMIDMAKKTGVRLQYSHLMFAGTKSHSTYQQCLDAIDAAIAEGVDVQIDTYPYHCGNSILGVVVPRWFREDVPANYENPEALARLEKELMALSTFVGLGYGDIQLTNAGHPDFAQYNGLFISQIAERLGLSPFESFVAMAKKCHGRRTTILLHKYSNMEIIDALMRHPASLFMTDAVPGKKTGNPAAYGSFPLFLQYARERKQIGLEEAVRKMTGATADRFKFAGRGYLKKGMGADVTIFDAQGVKDNNTIAKPDQAPTGIEAVFINGKQVLKDGKVDTATLAGTVLQV